VLRNRRTFTGNVYEQGSVLALCLDQGAPLWQAALADAQAAAILRQHA